MIFQYFVADISRILKVFIKYVMLGSVIVTENAWFGVRLYLHVDWSTVMEYNNKIKAL